MREFTVQKDTVRIPIGIQGENGAEKVLFPVADWTKDYGAGGEYRLIHKRKGDDIGYLAEITLEGDNVQWIINPADNAHAGFGVCELQYLVGETVVKSISWATATAESVEFGGDTPDPWIGWVEAVIEAAEAAEKSAKDAKDSADAAAQSALDADTASRHYPTIGENGNWYVWDVETWQYVDTGVHAQGPIGPNEVSSQTETDLSGVLTGDGSNVGSVPVDTVPSEGSSNLITSGAVEAAVSDINAKIPNQASAQNQLADKEYVDDSINSSTAFFRGSFASYAALIAVQWQTTDPTAPNFVSNNDYAYVEDDETHDDEAWRYIYVLEEGGQNNGWAPQYRINESPLTAAQIAALNSGITAERTAQITTNKNNLTSHTSNQSNPHSVTKAQVGLGNVDNTSDANKPISTATQAALNTKQDALTFDVTPTAGSLNPVTSSGIRAAIDEAEEAAEISDTAANAPASSKFSVEVNDAAAAPVLGTVIYGKSAVVNQLVEHGNFDANPVYYRCTVSISNNELSSTVTDTGGYWGKSGLRIINGHRYFLRLACTQKNSSSIRTALYNGNTIVDSSFLYLQQATNTKFYNATFDSANGGLFIYGQNGQTDKFKNFNLLDLTAIFQSDAASITTYDELQSAWLAKFGSPLPAYIPYNAGSVVSNNATYQLHGRNCWDEEWELGDLVYATGANYPDSTRIRSKNYNLCSAETVYYVAAPQSYTGNIFICFYDENKAYLGGSNSRNIGVRTTFTSPAYARYMRFSLQPAYGTTYNHNICINLSDSSFNGQYEPYFDGGSITADGLNGFNETVRDSQSFEQKRRMIGSLDLGDYDYTNYKTGGYQTNLTGTGIKVPSGGGVAVNAISPLYIAVPANNTLASGEMALGYDMTFYVVNSAYPNDPAAFKAAMAGVKLFFELATPVTESVTPADLHTQAGYNCLEPVSGDIQSGSVTMGYWKNQVIPDQLEKLQDEIDGKQDLLTFDTVPTAGSTNPVTSGGIKTALDGKQDLLTFDEEPTHGSANPAKSGGIYDMIMGLLETKDAENDPANRSFAITVNDAAATPVKGAKLYGKSAVINQFFGSTNSRDVSAYGVTITRNIVDGVVVSVTITDTATTTTNIWIDNFPALAGHTYYVGTNNANIRTYFSASDPAPEVIYTMSSDGTGYFGVRLVSGQVYNDTFTLKCIDLTACGFSSAETTDVATMKTVWLKKFGCPLPQYIPYNAGSVVSNNATYQLHGRNIWDEEWEVGGIDASGQNSVDATRIRSKNYIPVTASGTYYGKSPSNSYTFFLFYYDSNKNYISSDQIASNRTFTVPDNAKYARFYLSTGYGTTYHNDICINVSDASFNGQYEAYFDGGSITADGLNGIGTALDVKVFEGATATKTTIIDNADLGTLNWTEQVAGALYVSSGLASVIKPPTDIYHLGNYLCANYENTTASAFSASTPGKFSVAQNGALYFAATSEASLSGVTFYFEKATATTDTTTSASLTTQKGYNCLEPVSGAVQSAKAEMTYYEDDPRTNAIAEYVADQLAGLEARIAALENE